MTDSSTPCSRKPPERRRLIGAALALAAACGLGLAPAAARAAEAEIRNAALVLSDDTYVLNADIVAELTPLLADVVARGVSLYFVTEFELAAPRWYWRVSDW